MEIKDYYPKENPLCHGFILSLVALLLFQFTLRQIILLLLLLIIIPIFVGIDGIMYSGPIVDFPAGVVTIVMIIVELRRKEYHRV